jgi:hypothetical protein
LKENNGLERVILSDFDYSIDIYKGKAYRPQGFALSVFPSQAKFDPLFAEKI